MCTAFSVRLLGLAVHAIGGHGVAVVRIVVVERARVVHNPRIIRVAGIRTAQPLIPGRISITLNNAEWH